MSLLTATALTKDTVSADLTMTGGTAFTDASSHTFYIPTEGKTLLLVDNTYAGTLTVSVAAGAYIGAKASTFTVAQSYALVIIDLSGFKHKAFGAGTDSSGTNVGGVVTITFSTSGTGFVRVVTLPA